MLDGLSCSCLRTWAKEECCLIWTTWSPLWMLDFCRRKIRSNSSSPMAGLLPNLGYTVKAKCLNTNRQSVCTVHLVFLLLWGESGEKIWPFWALFHRFVGLESICGLPSSALPTLERASTHAEGGSKCLQGDLVSIWVLSQWDAAAQLFFTSPIFFDPRMSGKSWLVYSSQAFTG